MGRGNSQKTYYHFKITTFPGLPAKKMKKVLLTQIEQLIGTQPQLRKRLMSPFPTQNASNSDPFLLSMNALQVLLGFAHVFHPIQPRPVVLELHVIAKQNKLIWYGISRLMYGDCETSKNKHVLENRQPLTPDRCQLCDYSNVIFPHLEVFPRDDPRFDKIYRVMQFLDLVMANNQSLYGLARISLWMRPWFPQRSPFIQTIYKRSLSVVSSHQARWPKNLKLRVEEKLS